MFRVQDLDLMSSIESFVNCVAFEINFQKYLYSISLKLKWL